MTLILYLYDLMNLLLFLQAIHYLGFDFYYIHKFLHLFGLSFYFQLSLPNLFLILVLKDHFLQVRIPTSKSIFRRYFLSILRECFFLHFLLFLKSPHSHLLLFLHQMLLLLELGLLFLLLAILRFLMTLLFLIFLILEVDNHILLVFVFVLFLCFLLYL